MLSTCRAPALAIAGLVALALVAACGSTGTTSSPSSAAPTASASSPSGSTTPSEPVDTDPLTHHLLSEDFASDAGVFHTGATADYRFSVADGTYHVLSTTVPGSPAMTYGEYARVAFAIDSSVDVVDAASLPRSAWLGLGCLSPDGATGIFVVVLADGSQAAVYPYAKGDFGEALLISDTRFGTVSSLSLSTYITAVTDDAVTVTASVNGQPLAGKGTGDGFQGCSGMVLMLDTMKKGVETQFDNAVATVPGE
jgi:hypothetical protein